MDQVERAMVSDGKHDWSKPCFRYTRSSMPGHGVVVELHGPRLNAMVSDERMTGQSLAFTTLGQVCLVYGLVVKWADPCGQDN